MKIMTVAGTRPEWIRLSIVIKKLDVILGKNHILVHTGQNYDYNLNDIFFKELELRSPDVFIGAKGSFGKQIGIILEESEKIIKKYNPDKLLLLGDTNTDLSAYIAERLGIPVYHCEAGNRCYDKKVPEEVNRRMIDHISTYNLPYTFKSFQNLIKEGLPKTNIFITGNPIYEVINYYNSAIDNSNILENLAIIKNKYFLATFHRAETTDNYQRLTELIKSLENISFHYKLPVICSIHPRTKQKLNEFNIFSKTLTMLEPLGFFDFVKLEQNARMILSDSGTVCEEACILRVPHIILRDSTERPETVETGASMVSGISQERITNCVKIMLTSKNNWKVPEEYLDENVSEKIIKFLFQKLNLEEK